MDALATVSGLMSPPGSADRSVLHLPWPQLLGNGAKATSRSQGVVVRMALVQQPHGLRPLCVASLMKCPHQRMTVGGINLHPTVVNLGQRLNLHIIAPLALALYPCQKLFKWLRHELLEIASLACDVLCAPVSQQGMVVRATIDLVREGAKEAVSVTGLLTHHERRWCRGVACGSSHWQLGPVAHVAVVTQRLIPLRRRGHPRSNQAPVV
mmetsp:Transcript_10005/g.24160  ORF Transcript_10005/g.24160 Transcript_10005/m.24160 type:complete len:210 (-) Transcript_10005:98-727(-)